MKKLMLGALAALCAMLALPAFASATPAHLDKVPEGGFGLHGEASELTRVAGGKTTGETVSGNGSFENTTTGTVTLKFSGVRAEGVFNCTTAGQATGVVTTTELPFHLIMIETNKPGILITGKPTVPKTETDHFASFNCGIFVGNIVVKGTGIIGTITSPECGKPNTSATVSFEAEAPGVQKHRTWTGNTYDLKSSIAGGEWSTSAMKAHATITFNGGARTLVCTH